jgi:hypothetical protein
MPRYTEMGPVLVLAPKGHLALRLVALEQVRGEVGRIDVPLKTALESESTSVCTPSPFALQLQGNWSA